MKARFSKVLAGIIVTAGAAVFLHGAHVVAQGEPTSRASPPATNPLAWRELAVMPPISDPLTDAQYEEHLKKVTLPDILADGAAAPLTTSVVVTGAFPHSHALEEKVAAGDVLAAIDGEPLNYDWEFASRRKLSEQQLDIVSVDGKSRRIPLAPGLLGVAFTTRWNAAAAWGASSVHDPRFDAFIRVAAASLHHDAALCQSALSRAQRAGCDGHIGGCVPPGIAGELAFENFQFADAVDIDSLAIKGMPAPDNRLFARHFHDAALASGTLTAALDIDQRFPELSFMDSAKQRIHDVIDMDRAAGSPAEPCALAQLDTAHFRDASARVISLLTGNDDTTDSTGTAKELRERGKLDLIAPKNEYRLFLFGPTGRNIDASLDVTFTASDHLPEDQSPSFTFGLIDNRIKGIPFMKISLFEFGDVSVQRYGGNDYRLLMPAPKDGHWHARMLIVGRRCQALINGYTIFSGPVSEDEKDRKLGTLVQPVGVHAVAHDYTWRIAEERTK